MQTCRDCPPACNDKESTLAAVRYKGGFSMPASKLYSTESGAAACPGGSRIRGTLPAGKSAALNMAPARHDAQVKVPLKLFGRMIVDHWR